jgi:hypothetical protein
MNNFANFYLLLAGFLLGLFFDPEDARPKHQLTFNGLHFDISQKIELFNTLSWLT